MNAETTPQRFEFTRWFNVYRREDGGFDLGIPSDYKCECDETRFEIHTEKCIACIELIITGEVGQGL